MNRCLRSELPAHKKHLKSEPQKNKHNELIKQQKTQKRYFDKNAQIEHRQLNIGDSIRYKMHKDEWAPGTITKTKNPGNRDYEILNKQNNKLRRNRVHIFKTTAWDNQSKTEQDQTKTKMRQTQQNIPTITNTEGAQHAPYITRFGRVSKPVDRLGYDVK